MSIIKKLFLIIILPALLAQSLHAQEIKKPTGGFGVRLIHGRGEDKKGYFALNLKPGESTKRKFEISNYSSKPIKVVVFAADAWNSPDGALAGTFYDDRAKVKSVGRWIKLNKPEVEIKPNSNEEIGLDFAVPADTKPGDSFGFIFVQPVEDYGPAKKLKEKEAGVAIKIVQRIGIVIWQRTPGEHKTSMEISDVEKEVKNGVLHLNFQVSNTGNLFIKPVTSWKLLDDQNKTLMQGDIPQNAYVLPASKNTISIPIVSRRPIPRGEYLLKANISDGKEYSVNKEFKVELP